MTIVSSWRKALTAPSPSTSVFDACPLIQIKGELRE